MASQEGADVPSFTGVFGMGVAARMTGMDPQSLRLYERRGLLTPDRTAGGTRLYSSDDIARLERIGELLREGLNIAGVALVLDLESANERLAASERSLRRKNRELAAENRRLERGGDA